MKALVYTNPKKAEFLEVAEPQAKAGALKVKMKYCGVCGSDIGIYMGKHPRAKAPLIFGHEFLGVLEESGTRFSKGDKVVAYPLLSCGHCRPCTTGQPHVCESLKLIGIDVDGGMGEFAYVDEDVLFKVPEGVSDIAAATIEPLAVIIRAIHQSGFKALDKVAVIGAGPIGMITGLVLKKMGAAMVMISDIDENRLAKAEGFGLIAVNARKESFKEILMDKTDRVGVDVLYECSGAKNAALEMSDLTRVSGTICMVAVHKEPHEVNLRDINFKEQTLIGTRVYTLEEFGQAVEYSKEISDDLEKIVTNIIPMSEGGKVFDLILQPDSGTIKVLIDCEKTV
jgi:threonine dehydrogenase-like Zn-dependent dehydrogenase